MLLGNYNNLSAGQDVDATILGGVLLTKVVIDEVGALDCVVANGVTLDVGCRVGGVDERDDCCDQK
jgi:hypothetical protein